MKYRDGFVSNSSSTSFVIAVARDFSPTEEQIKKFTENYNEYNEYNEEAISLETGKEIIDAIVNHLCSSEIPDFEVCLSSPDGEDENYITLDRFLNIFREVILKTEDMGGSGQDMCVNILADLCINKVKSALKKQMETYHED
jgi:hypothetical protein